MKTSDAACIGAAHEALEQEEGEKAVAKTGDEADISCASRKKDETASAAERELRRRAAREKLKTALANLAKVEAIHHDDAPAADCAAAKARKQS